MGDVVLAGTGGLGRVDEGRHSLGELPPLGRILPGGVGVGVGPQGGDDDGVRERRRCQDDSERTVGRNDHRLAESGGVAAAGADFVEVGVPFSDPLADGPTIQRTTQTALEQGMTLPHVLELIHEAALEVPVVIMTYLNPVLALGIERFIHDAVEAGVAGVLLTDLPAGADEVIERAVTNSSLSLIRLVAPTTDDSRLMTALQGASGFVYLISRLGVTGARDTVPTDLEQHVRRIRAVTRLPIAVGFGIAPRFP